VKHKVHQVQRKPINSHKVCSKCPPLAWTQAHKHVGHLSTASSIIDCSKPPHTCSRRCGSSSMSWHWRHIYVTCKIHKWIAYLERAFIPVSRYVKITKIHQDFLELWSQMYCHATFLWITVYVQKQIEWSVFQQKTPATNPHIYIHIGQGQRQSFNFLWSYYTMVHKNVAVRLWS